MLEEVIVTKELVMQYTGDTDRHSISCTECESQIEIGECVIMFNDRPFCDEFCIRDWGADD